MSPLCGEEPNILPFLTENLVQQTWLGMSDKLIVKMDTGLVLYLDEAAINDVEVRLWVAYDKEMLKVFQLSKINLNITSRSIESGILQRVWDINRQCY